MALAKEDIPRKKEGVTLKATDFETPVDAFVTPDTDVPGLVAWLLQEGKKSESERMEKIFEYYNAIYAVVRPTKEKPILQYPHNTFDTEGGIQTLVDSIKEKGWRHTICTSRAFLIDMGSFYYAIGGWKRSAAIQRLQRDSPQLDEVSGFPGFESVVFQNPDLAYDGQTAKALVDDANSTNSLNTTLILIDKVLRSQELTLRSMRRTCLHDHVKR